MFHSFSLKWFVLSHGIVLVCVHAMLAIIAMLTCNTTSLIHKLSFEILLITYAVIHRLMSYYVTSYPATFG